MSYLRGKPSACLCGEETRSFVPLGEWGRLPSGRGAHSVEAGGAAFEKYIRLYVFPGLLIARRHSLVDLLSGTRPGLTPDRLP